ncbi:MAG: N-formylglutamate amidohydrolase [Phycisphaerales bacterium]|nr:N-formylglutamate amidohydrolase [Phycisphaerales bacterium]
MRRAILPLALFTLTLGLHQPPQPLKPRSAELADAADLITTQRGTLPIIISAPHGGSIRVPGSKDRAAKGAVTVRDVNTADIALLVAQRLTDKLGAKPYFVIAQFPRKDADPNRAEDEAVENDAARAQYRAYHRALQAAVSECRERFGDALLIDLHGQVKRPEALVRGTRNGKTVSALVKRAGLPALSGPDSLFGQLKAKGYAVIPDVGENADGNAAEGRETFFDGGFIVAHYGSDQPGGIDAVQVEIGADRSSNLVKVARDIADAATHTLKTFYLKPSP